MTYPTVDHETFSLTTPDGSLRLRPLRLSDAPNLRDRCADQRNVEFIPHLQGKQDQTVQEVETWIKSVLAGWNKETLFLVVEDATTSKVIAEGPLGFINWQDKWAESGIMVDFDQRGKAVATKALKSSMDFAFKELKLEQVRYGTLKANGAMAKVLGSKLGKVQVEEKVRKDGKEELNFVFKREDWLQENP